ncbi:DUF1080 domain-containing protein [Novosphingobium sp. TH158]|uniref:3-keto-disaccharide hydrolase n=1 Tax=Novosphingobium sp. TH158 TaxID=2067455 RepID=UPI00130448E0|nr:DUF1080 domain-containing protein [Novosphingobium sp. TH158]
MRLATYGLALLAAGASIAPLAAKPAREVALFNGKDLSGWTFFLEEKEFNTGGKGRISDFARVLPGGVLEIRPRMHGALITRRDYLNYRLRAEFRWPEPGPRDDSGLFLRVRPPFAWDMVHGEMARFYMFQIQPGNTGDLWVMGYSESLLKTDPARSFQPFGNLPLGPGGHIRRHVKTHDAERPAGEWNALEAVIEGKTVKVYVNGQLVNEGRNLADLPGRIGLESERGTIQYRNIRLLPLPDKAGG